MDPTLETLVEIKHTLKASNTIAERNAVETKKLREEIGAHNSSIETKLDNIEVHVNHNSTNMWKLTFALAAAVILIALGEKLAGGVLQLIGIG